MSKQEQPHEKQRDEQGTAPVCADDQTANPEGGSYDQHAPQPGVRAVRDQPHAVLPVGAHRRAGQPERLRRPEARAEETTPQRRAAAGRSATPARGDRRTQQREPAAQKKTLAISPERRYTAEEKKTILGSVQHAQELCPERELAALLADLGLPRATYYRWSGRELTDDLADRIVTPQREAIPPTPAEVATVRDFAVHQPLLGYKRLTYALMAEHKAFLREWMVRGVLSAAQLLGRRTPLASMMRRPPEPNHPDQRWHTDLMMWHFNGRWFYLVDVLDAYSRYLVQCELLLTAGDDAVILAVQRACETLTGRARLAG